MFQKTPINTAFRTQKFFKKCFNIKHCLSSNIQFGVVNHIIVSAKKKGSAVVEFKSVEAAVSTLLWCPGFVICLLKLDVLLMLKYSVAD